jgi:hypothetical protein
MAEKDPLMEAKRNVNKVTNVHEVQRTRRLAHLAVATVLIVVLGAGTVFLMRPVKDKKGEKRKSNHHNDFKSHKNRYNSMDTSSIAPSYGASR